MKSNTVAALVGLVAMAEAHTHGHSHVHQSHNHTEALLVQKRGGQCEFPTDAGLVAVTPDSSNAGWAMSPDQTCTAGSWCPYACPPGKVSMQWNPKATSYTYPISMDGGLYCNEDGSTSKPFPDKDYCVDATGPVTVVNNAGDPLSFCQTVLPGNEAMLIPTLVTDTASIAVPGTDYWCSTAAHYYINPPGTGVEGCIWGTNEKPIGNWAYFVAGANTDDTGNTYVKIGYNPVVQEATTPFRDTPATFGVEITCDDNAGCNGLPCKIDPSVNGLNQLTSNESSDGAGGAAFCVVTVPSGKTANIVVFEAGSSGSSSSSSSASPTSTSSSSSSSTSLTPTSTAAPTTTSHSSASSTSPASSYASSSDVSPTASATPSKTPSASYSNAPHVFVETSSSSGVAASATSGSASAVASTSTTETHSSGASAMSSGSITGLIVFLIAGLVLQF